MAADEFVDVVEHGDRGSGVLEYVPHGQQAQRCFAQLCFAGGSSRAFEVVLVPDRGQHHAALGKFLAAAHHDDGGRSGCRDPQTDRPQHQRIETAQPALTDHGGAVLRPHPVQTGDGVPAAVLRGDVEGREPLRDRSGRDLQQVTALRVNAFGDLSREVGDPVGGVARAEDVKGAVASGRLGGGPERGCQCGARSVDTDDDRAEVRTVLGGAFHGFLLCRTAPGGCLHTATRARARNGPQGPVKGPKVPCPLRTASATAQRRGLVGPGTGPVRPSRCGRTRRMVAGEGAPQGALTGRSRQEGHR